MPKIGIIVAGMLVTFSSSILANPINNGEQASTQLVAKASHACGERRYEVNGTALETEDESAVRYIISFLYEGASILFEYPGAPAPTINDETRKRMANNPYIRDVELRQISNPSQQQVEQAVQNLYALDPVSWNIHNGPSHEQIKKTLADARFANQLGPQAIKLIENRLKGKLGQRPQIIEELAKHFNVKEVPNYWTNENCEILGGFGPD